MPARSKRPYCSSHAEGSYKSIRNRNHIAEGYDSEGIKSFIDLESTIQCIDRAQIEELLYQNQDDGKRVVDQAGSLGCWLYVDADELPGICKDGYSDFVGS